PAKEKNSPSLHPLTQLRSARPGGASPFGRVDSTLTIDGRPAVVIRTQHYTSLIAADYDRTYEFTVTPADLDEGAPRIKRFFESGRLPRPVAAEPRPAVGRWHHRGRRGGDPAGLGPRPGAADAVDAAHAQGAATQPGEDALVPGFLSRGPRPDQS